MQSSSQEQNNSASLQKWEKQGESANSELCANGADSIRAEFFDPCANGLSASEGLASQVSAWRIEWRIGLPVGRFQSVTVEREGGGEIGFVIKLAHVIGVLEEQQLLIVIAIELGGGGSNGANTRSDPLKSS